jgi:hypothetical protein
MNGTIESHNEQPFNVNPLATKVSLMDGKDKDQGHKPHQDIQDKREDESSNPISHEDRHPI